MREARDQSSRSREAIDQFGFHRVMHENEDDGYARRRFLCCKRGGKRYSNEKINRKRNKFRSQRTKAIILP